MSSSGGETEILCSTRALPVLIPSRHRQIESAGSERGLGRCAIALDGDDRRARSACLARPGGTITGVGEVAAELSAKRLEVLKDTFPSLRKIAMLWNAADLGMTPRYRSAETAARTLGFEIQALGVREPEDFTAGFAAMVHDRPDAILMVTDALMALNRKRVFEFAAQQKLPAIYEYAFLVRDGGLMSYGPDMGEVYDRAADLGDRILKGARPADLPFEQPTRFRLVINKKTLETLGHNTGSDADESG